MFPLFPFFHFSIILSLFLNIFHIFHVGQRPGVFRVYDAVSERSPAAAGWMALEL